jgi:hypothetical protein
MYIIVYAEDTEFTGRFLDYDFFPGAWKYDLWYIGHGINLLCKDGF